MPRRTVLALRHVAFEDLGLLTPVLARNGWSITYVEAPTDDLTAAAIDDADLLIVLGGPIGVYETATYPFLRRELALLERRLSRKKPTLGICLGSQLIASVLGARVYAGAVKEIGWGPVSLTAEGKRSCLAALSESASKVLHWHGDTFDLPEGAVRLASNEFYENQAFAYGGQTLALQFHVEADPARLESWYVGHAAELSATRTSIAELRAATQRTAEQARTQAERIFEAWLADIQVAD